MSDYWYGFASDGILTNEERALRRISVLHQVHILAAAVYRSLDERTKSRWQGRAPSNATLFGADALPSSSCSIDLKRAGSGGEGDRGFTVKMFYTVCTRYSVATVRPSIIDPVAYRSIANLRCEHLFPGLFFYVVILYVAHSLLIMSILIFLWLELAQVVEMRGLGRTTLKSLVRAIAVSPR